ncbi:hypothetical protein A4X13_0g4765 [Tilletia indica]|uniref:Nucleolar complex-associated protein 3 n=1 Tax=Tilletia indica TaxID=43049 RepID=A0A177TRL9_9BASI|nr:hypothetical protein A4X13_0g4765 [Tilletia indica]
MARPQKSAKGKARAVAPAPAPTARGKAKKGKPHSAEPTRKRPRIDDDQQDDDFQDEGGEDEAGVNGVQGNMDSDLDSDAEEALAYFGEDLDSDEDLPAIIDEDDDDGESDLDSEDDDEDISDISDDDADSDKEDDDAREDRYAARVSRLSKRTEIQKTEEDDRQSRKRLPVRGLAGDWNEDAHSSSEEEDDEDDDDEEEDEEGKALAAAYDEAASTVAPTLPSTSGAKNRAIHNDRVLDKLRSEQAQRAAEAAAEEASDHRVLSAKARKAESAASAVASNSLLLGNRFGMMAPYAVMMLPKRSLRIHQAREQIAHLSQNIVNDPEVGLAHLRRLLVFAGRDVLAPLKTPTGQIGDGEEKGAFEDEDGAATLSNKKRKREMWKRKQQMKKKANGADQDGEEDDDEDDDDDDLEAGLPARARADIDPPIRQLAMLSLMAVFSDIIPGYRIRALTEEEKAQKTTQDVSRRRDWEEGLLKSYREFLELCEQAIKARDELSSTALHALCHILTRATHFNYRQNLLRLIIARLSRSRARNAASASLAADASTSDGGTTPRPAVTRGSWDADCTQCSSAIVEVLQRDHSGEVSLEVVRLLHRMIKEGGYAVDARVLDILLHLRLKEELGDVRASMTTSVGGRFSKKRKDGGEGLGREDPRHRMGKGKVKPKDVRKGKGEHLSKKAVKKMKEVREIEKEMKEAEAEVDKEEREKHHTETLKLLFVLYFSILKSPSAPSALLCSALDGLCKYGHRINVEFFRDLIRVLRDLVVEARRQSEGGGIGSVYAQGGPTMLNGVVVPNGPSIAPKSGTNGVPGYPNGSAYGIGGASQAKRSHRDTLCLLLTAFDLLFSQGQSLNLDLSDFIAHLYSVMLSLALEPTVEDAPEVLITEGDRSDAKEAVRAVRRDARAAKGFAASSLADLLFRTLELALLKPRTSTLPPERLGSFVKRLLSCALHWPAGTAVRALTIVRTIVGRDARLEALFETEDRAVARRSNVPTALAAAATASHNHQQKHGGRGNLAAATLANLSDEVLDRVAGSAGPDEKGPLGAGEVAWEVVLLAQHVNEDVRDAAVRVLGSVGTAPKNPGATRRR